MKTALVYDRVNKWGGAERVLLTLHEMFPEAPLYTSVYNPKTAPWAKVFCKVIPSLLQKIPFASRNHEFLGALTPIAFENFDFSQYDLVISVTSEAAKGIITKPGTLHICYCLTPTRYLWSGYDLYFQNPIMRLISKPIVSYLRQWDKIAAKRPDVMVAISSAAKERIKKYYGRESKIIFPPVDLKVPWVSQVPREYFLVVSRLVAYKKVDLAIEAFNKLKLPLVIVGTGSEEWKLKLGSKKNIKFLGEVSERKLAELYAEAKALVMPQEEDFGLVAVEAQVAGTPVIAYRKSGALDTVVNGKTGVFFDEQTPESLALAVKKFDKCRFNPTELIHHAKNFSKERFKKELLKLINGRR